MPRDCGICGTPTNEINLQRCFRCHREICYVCRLIHKDCTGLAEDKPMAAAPVEEAVVEVDPERKTRKATSSLGPEAKRRRRDRDTDADVQPIRTMPCCGNCREEMPLGDLRPCDTCGVPFCRDCFYPHRDTCGVTATATPATVVATVARPVPIRAHGTESRGVLDAASLSIGIGTWNINHLGKDTEEPKKSDKLNAIRALFTYNEWLELLALQEVNKTGAPLLEETFPDEELVRVLHRGPFLYTESYETEIEYVIRNRKAFYAKLRKPVPKKTKQETADLLATIKAHDGHETWYQYAEEREIKMRYQEYYPLIARRDAEAITVERVHLYWGTGVITHHAPDADVNICYKDGDKELQTGRVHKASNGNRPIIVYELEKRRQRFFVGVVHTSPADDEWYRATIYREQMKAVFAHVADSVREGTYWVLLGDFYFTPESRVLRRNEIKSSGRVDLDADRNVLGATFEKMLPKELEIVTAISGTNWKVAKRVTILNPKAPPWKKFDQAQIADFLVCGRNWETARAGLFKDPALMAGSESGGLMIYDEYHRALHAWDTISDHAPVGAYLSTRDDPGVLEILGYDEHTLDCARRNIEELRGTWLAEKEKLAQILEAAGERPMAPKKRFLYDWRLEQYKNRINWLARRDFFEPTDFAPNYRGGPAEPAHEKHDPKGKGKATAVEAEIDEEQEHFG